MLSPTVVEFLGTALLISAVAFGSSPLLIVAALAIAIAFGGRISGGHFNPAVTLFQYMNGKVSQNRALMYVAAQLAAGVAIVFLRSVI